MKNVNTVDTTLFFNDGGWWLFTVIDKIDSPLAIIPELYLFYTDDFLSDNWTSHPMNPVFADIRNARPAGHHRIAQACTGILLTKIRLLLLQKLIMRRRISSK
jgi:hypothetical protein